MRACLLGRSFPSSCLSPTLLDRLSWAQLLADKMPVSSPPCCCSAATPALQQPSLPLHAVRADVEDPLPPGSVFPQAYHSSYNDATEYSVAGNTAILPLRTRIRGPAPSLGVSDLTSDGHARRLTPDLQNRPTSQTSSMKPSRCSGPTRSSATSKSRAPQTGHSSTSSSTSPTA